MAKQSNFPTLWKQIHQYRSYAPSLPVISAITLLLVGGAVLLALPDNPDEPEMASATAAANAPDASPVDDSLCDKQAWPYIDQRCAQQVEAARGTRQVRIVTDKGNSVNVVTPVPIVEAKPKPAPQRPVVAQIDAPVIGPAVVAPQVPENAPQIEKVAEAPQSAPVSQNPTPQPQVAPEPAPKAQTAAAPPATPAATDAMARDTENPPAKVQNAAVEPAAMSDSPVSAGVDVIEAQPKKSKAELKREARREAREAKQARREAKRRALEQDGDVPDEVVATVRALPAEGQSRRRGRGRGVEVPDEVLAAVERAAARELGRRGGRVVTVGSPHGGERMYIVPSDRGGW